MFPKILVEVLTFSTLECDIFWKQDHSDGMQDGVRMELRCSRCSVSQLCLSLCDPWTVALQASLSMGFSRQEYSSGLPFPSPGDLPDPGIESASPASLALQTSSLPLSQGGRPHAAVGWTPNLTGLVSL